MKSMMELSKSRSVFCLKYTKKCFAKKIDIYASFPIITIVH